MMCLAVPGKIIECENESATVDLQGNRLQISRVLTPEAEPGSWVLVHAGFAISVIQERDAVETWKYLKACYDGEISEIQRDAGAEGAQP